MDLGKASGLKRRKVSWRRVGAIGALVALLTVAAYLWQPLRFEFFPPSPPKAASVLPKDVGLFNAGTRVLIVAGHPDDSEFYLGGTLVKMSKAGVKLRLVCMTDGDKAFYPFGVPDNLTTVRRQEQRAASAIWKGDVVFLGYRDGRLGVNDDTIKALSSIITGFAPDVILSPDTTYHPRRFHEDHDNAGKNADAAIARIKWSGIQALYNSSFPNCLIDVTGVWEIKMRAVLLHKSQFGGAKGEFIGKMLRRHAENVGRDNEYDLAEGLRIQKRSAGQ